MELGTSHETWSYLHYQAKIQIWEWGRERFREEKDRWNPIYKPMLHIPPLLDVTFSIRASLFFFSLCLCCVCVLALFFFFFCISIFFPFVWLSLFTEKFQRNCSLIFLSTNQLMEQSESVFLPQFLTSWSVVPYYFHFSDSWHVTPLLLRCGLL